MLFKKIRMFLAFIIVFICVVDGTHYSQNVRTFRKTGGFKTTERKPIVMVPGILGSRLEAKLDRDSPKHFWCSKTADWYAIWLNVELLLPELVDCWEDDIRMLIDNSTGKISNQEGVSIRTKYFGTTTAFEYLDTNEYAPGSPYFNGLVKAMVEFGYTRGQDLKGAPYDWRMVPSLLSVFLKNLTRVVEDNYYEHFNRKVVIIAHSMGNLAVYKWLRSMSEEWKDKFVDSFISINGPYIGSVKAVKSLTSGETEGHDFILPKLKLRTVTRSWPSSYLLLPNPLFWPEDKKQVVDTLKRNYTVDQYDALFERIKCPECIEMWKQFNAEIGNLDAPGVAVHCVYSSLIPTAEVLIYDEDLFPDGTPVLKTGDGDGTVNTFSSSYCLKWKGHQNQEVHDVHLPGNDHVRILNNVTLHKYIENVVTLDTSKLHGPK